MLVFMTSGGPLRCHTGNSIVNEGMENILGGGTARSSGYCAMMKKGVWGVELGGVDIIRVGGAGEKKRSYGVSTGEKIDVEERKDFVGRKELWGVFVRVM